MRDIMISVYMTTYNHEKYVRQALDSVLKQKTDYSYEILIGDDVSTDGTRLILKEYEEKYPEIIKVFYREENMYGKAPDNGDDLRSRCRGKYVIALEGDDFWIDDEKLQKQVLFLELHPEYIAVAHNCTVVDNDGNPINEYPYPECKEKDYTMNMFLQGILPGQLATVMYRNYLFDSDIDTSILGQGLMPTDRLIYFMLGIYGKIYCMQEKMSAYRFVYDTGSSFTANYKYEFGKEENWNRKLLEYAYRTKKKNAIKCAEILYARALWKGLQKGKITFGGFLKLLHSNCKNNLLLVCRIIYHKLKPREQNVRNE